MSIVRNVGFCEFCDAFHDADRNENFSYQGKRILFDYLEQYSEDAGEPVDLDIIALCVEYNEDDIDTIIEEYSIDISDAIDEEDKTEIVREYLTENTFVVGETSSGFVFACF